MNQPVPIERALSIYIEKRCTWQQVSFFLREETGHFWNAATINSAVNRFRAGIPQRSGAWDEEKIERLKELWSQCSASVIARELSVTRNAVIGMVQRLGLAGKKPFKPEGPPKKKPPQKRLTLRERPAARLLPPLPYLPPPVKEYILGQGKPLLDLARDECRWALNECDPGETYFFCAAKKHGDLPFCEAHAARAYNAPAAEILKRAAERLKKTYGANQCA